MGKRQKSQIAKLREDLGINQEDAAERFGIDVTYYSRLESGKRKRSENHLRKWVEMFEMGIIYMTPSLDIS
jgi:transcriptional regulator with XRE-family HTH domain